MEYILLIIEEFQHGGMFRAYSSANNMGTWHGIRPVVTLKSDIDLTGSSEEGWTIKNKL